MLHCQQNSNPSDYIAITSLTIYTILLLDFQPYTKFFKKVTLDLSKKLSYVLSYESNNFTIFSPSSSIQVPCHAIVPLAQSLAFQQLHAFVFATWQWLPYALS